MAFEWPPAGDVLQRRQIYKFYFVSDAREIEARLKGIGLWL